MSTYESLLETIVEAHAEHVRNTVERSRIILDAIEFGNRLSVTEAYHLNRRVLDDLDDCNRRVTQMGGGPLRELVAPQRDRSIEFHCILSEEEAGDALASKVIPLELAEAMRAV